MFTKKKLRLKKFYFHPIVTYTFLTIILIIFSAILSKLQMQATYDVVNTTNNELSPTLVAVESMLTRNGIKFFISGAIKNFLSFAPLGTLIISLIGLSIAEATGMIEALTRRKLSKLPKYTITFIVIFLATISSLINEVGYAILIPLAALIYFINDRNPILGIVTAFCGVSFGYGVSIFVGTMETSLIKYTESAATLIDPNAHIALTSNLIFIIAASIILSIIGTLIIEKLIAPKIGHYKKDEDFAETQKYELFIEEEAEQALIEKDKNEKRGLKYALIASIVLLLGYAWMLIPNLPYSGLLLDMESNIYLTELFGESAYFENAFTYLIAIFLIITGLSYGIGARTIKHNYTFIERAGSSFNKLNSMFILIFVASQFIAIFKKTNIGLIITTWLADLVGILKFQGIPLIIITLLLIAIANIFLTSSESKWMIFSPIVVPLFMQSNIAPQFAQIVMRAGDSMTRGFTPFLASFVIYLGYLNIYNLDKDKPYTIKRSLKLITPYFLLISLSWIILIVLWYVTGLPIGPHVFPTI